MMNKPTHIGSINGIAGAAHVIGTDWSDQLRRRLGTLRVSAGDGLHLWLLAHLQQQLMYSGPVVVDGEEVVETFLVTIIHLEGFRPMDDARSTICFRRHYPD